MQNRDLKKNTLGFFQLSFSLACHLTVNSTFILDPIEWPIPRACLPNSVDLKMQNSEMTTLTC